MKKKVLSKQSNPVARAVRTLRLRGLVIPARKQEKRAKEKLRQSLREYRILPALFSPAFNNKNDWLIELDLSA